MVRWRLFSSPRAAITPSADCPIAVASLNLVSCRRTLAYDMSTAAITPPSKFDTWHSALPQKPHGGAGQDDGSEPSRTMTTRCPPWTVIENADSRAASAPWLLSRQRRGARAYSRTFCRPVERPRDVCVRAVNSRTTVPAALRVDPEPRRRRPRCRQENDSEIGTLPGRSRP
jgi:hypothetical protein